MLWCKGLLAHSFASRGDAHNDRVDFFPAFLRSHLHVNTSRYHT